jgi:phage portal protein BeeE
MDGPFRSKKPGSRRSLTSSVPLSEHSLEGLLRAQPKERAEFYKSGIDAGWLDVAEVRRLENLPQREVDGKSLGTG